MPRLARGLVLLVVLAAGWGGPAPVPVEGTVTGPDGKPMADILVQFVPTAGGGPAGGASGTTDANGKFALTADANKPGAAPGAYKVVLIDQAFAAGDDANPTARPAPNRIPKAYLSATETPLSVTVPSGAYDLKVERR